MLTKIFISIFNMSITATYIIAVILMVRGLVGKRFPKIFSYALWGIVLVRLLMPFGFSTGFSIFNLINTPQPSPSGRVEYVPQNMGQSPITNIGLGSIEVQSITPLVQENSANPMQIWVFIASLVWIAGVFLLLCRFLISYFYIRRKLRTAILYKKHIFFSDQVKSPIVFGVLHPKIILPYDIADICTDTEISHIITHEEVHIKRLDHIVKLISMTVAAVYWFNPFIWLAFILSNKDRELSCDEKVIQSAERDIRAEYATSLLNIGKRRNDIFGVIAFGESNIRARIKSIVSFKKPGLWIILTAIVLIGVLSASCLTNADRGEESSSETSQVSELISSDSPLPYAIQKRLAKKGYSLVNQHDVKRIYIRFQEDIAYKNPLKEIALDLTELVKKIENQHIDLYIYDTANQKKPLSSSKYSFLSAVVKDEEISYYPIESDDDKQKIIDYLLSVGGTQYDKTDRESVVKAAILSSNAKHYMGGETQTEGHIILETEEREVVKLYCLTSYGEFGFQNGIFTKLSGTGAIPTVITLSKNKFGEYALLEYKEPRDGSEYMISIKEMFPKELQTKLNKAHERYGELLMQEEAYAKEYLKSIGRENAEVDGNHVPKTILTDLGVGVEASNQLLDMFWDYPYWVGTEEKVEKGVRYIYSSTYDNKSEIVTYVKTTGDGQTVERFVIDVKNGELKFLEGSSRRSGKYMG